MSPNAGSQSRAVKRRQSILACVRPFTAGGEHSGASSHTRSHTSIWGHRDHASAREAPARFHTSDPLPDIVYPDTLHPPETKDAPEPGPSSTSKTKRHHSKSFSGLRHGVDGLRAVARRLSVSKKHKPPKQIPNVSAEDNTGKLAEATTQRGESKLGWFGSQRVPRQSSLSSLNVLGQGHSGSVIEPVPGSGSEPPVVPDDLSRGAAARAAAAAQNEMIKAVRSRSNSNDRRVGGNLGIDPTLDYESGIEINLEDQADGSDDELDVVRKDPSLVLPAELMVQVLSYLDADSLKRAELVSRVWNTQASSRHVWREVFLQEYQHRTKFSERNAARPKYMGLGKMLPKQDWKKIFTLRRTLEQRWKEGKAAAVYLHGHKDSVYCVQFDEKKIITGSRDRTIRVWDAHFPWPCLKVIGAPPDARDPAPIGPLAITPVPESTGSLPFISICPPVRSPADVMASHPQNDDYHQASILCLQFDDDIMVTGSSDHTCIVWDIKNDYTPIRRLEGHRAGVLDVCFDERYVVSCSKDTTIRVWDRHTGDLVRRLVGHRGPVNAVRLRGDLVVSASGDGVAKLWNITSGLCIKEFSSRDRGLACVEFSEDARTILAGGNDQVIYQFDANTGELMKEFHGHSGLVRSLHMDSASGRVVSGSYDMSVKVFDSKSGGLSIDLPGWTTSWMLSAKSDYRRIVATSQDSRAVIMDFGYGLDGIDLLEQ